MLTAIKTERTVDTVPAPKDQPKNSFGIVAPNSYHQFVVLCLDRKTGKTLWKRVATELVPHEGHHPDNDYASASPTTDGSPSDCTSRSMRMLTSANQAAMRASTVHEPMMNTPRTPA